MANQVRPRTGLHTPPDEALALTCSWPRRADRVGNGYDAAVDEVAADRRRQLDGLLDAGLPEAFDRGGGEPVSQVLDVAAERTPGLGEPAVPAEQPPGLKPARGLLPVVVAPAPGRLDDL